MASSLKSEPIGDGLSRCEDGLIRCAHAIDVPAFRDYHDNRFGYPCADDRAIFEKICVEIFASGLSFTNVLRRRDAYYDAFADFDIETVANFDDEAIASLMSNEALINNRRKIEACITNARASLKLIGKAGNLGAVLWHFKPKKSGRPDPMTLDYMKAHPSNAASAALAKTLKAHGFTFVGPVVAYGLMQGLGVVNDHFEECYRYEVCRQASADFNPPELTSEL